MMLANREVVAIARNPVFEAGTLTSLSRLFVMWMSFCRATQSESRLPNTVARSHFAAIACLAFLSLPVSASKLFPTGQAKLSQGLDGGNPQNKVDSYQRDPIKLLKRLAEEQLASDGKFLGKTRFSIDQQSHTFFYDLDAMPPSLVLSNSDPYAKSLEALIRVESLRRDFASTIPHGTFWPASLDSVEGAIERCVRDLENSESAPDAAESPEECFHQVDERFDALKTSILTYTATRGLKYSEPSKEREPVIGYRVHVIIDPPKARVKVMTYLTYKKYQYSNTPQEKYQWNDLLASDSDMIGWYHYRAEWPAELNGTEEGDFEVKGPSKITFKPNPK